MKAAAWVLGLGVLLGCWLLAGRDRIVTPADGVRARASDRGGRAAAARLPAPAGVEPGGPGPTSVEPIGGASVSGSVEDVSGGVVVGALVTAMAEEDPFRTLAVATTDGTGRFELKVPPGLVRISAAMDGYAGDEIEVLAPAGEVQLRMAPAAQLVGRVIARGTGAPVEGATVTAIRRGGGRAAADSARTDRDGAFKLTRLGPGGYDVVATGAHWRSGPRWIVVGIARAGAPIVLEVFPASTITGTIAVDKRPCSDGRVELDGPTSLLARAGSDGVVRFDGVMPGTYAAAIHCAGAADARDTFEVIAGIDPPPRAWDLARGLSVTGSVETVAGTPAAGVEVTVAPTAGGGRRRPAGCLTGADGTFACSGLEPGGYDCFAAGGREPASDTVAVTVAPGAAARIKLRLRGRGDVRASVVSATGAPVDRAVIVALRDGVEAAVGHRVGPGEFLLHELALGSYQIVPGRDAASRPFGQTVRLERDGAVVSIRLASPPTATIAGRVLGDRGEPIADAWVRAQSNDLLGTAGEAAVAITGDDGSFSLAGLPSGRYTILAAAEIGEGSATDVDAGAMRVEVRLRAFGEISGTTQDARGRPVTSFVLTTVSDGRSQSRRVFDPEGKWTLPGLSPGTWRIVAESEAGSGEREVALAPGHQARVALVLASRGAGSPDPDESTGN